MDTKQGLMEMPPGSLGRSSVFALAGGLVTSVAWNVLVGWHRKPASGRLNKVNMKQGLRERETKIKKKAGLCKWRQKSRKLKKQIKRSRYIYTPTFICTEVQWYLNREEGCNELMGWELRVGWELHGAGWRQGSLNHKEPTWTGTSWYFKKEEEGNPNCPFQNKRLAVGPSAIQEDLHAYPLQVQELASITPQIPVPHTLPLQAGNKPPVFLSMSFFSVEGFLCDFCEI